MIATTLQPNTRRQRRTSVTAPRQTAIVLAIWRCYTDNGYWPNVQYIANQTGFTASAIISDLAILINQGYVRPLASTYKLIVRREV